MAKHKPYKYLALDQDAMIDKQICNLTKSYIEGAVTIVNTFIAKVGLLVMIGERPSDRLVKDLAGSDVFLDAACGHDLWCLMKAGVPVNEDVLARVEKKIRVYFIMIASNVSFETASADVMWHAESDSDSVASLVDMLTKLP